MTTGELVYTLVEANGLNFFYFEKGEGQPLILLHGGSLNAEINWKVNIEILSNHFWCIAVDNRGHGRTVNPTREYSYELMADDIAAIITALNLQNPVVCGWSDGGQIALEIGIRHPNKVKAIIVGGALMNNIIPIDFWKSTGINGPGNIDFEKFREVSPGLYELVAEAHKSQGSEYWKTMLEDLTKLWLNDESYPGDRVRNIKTPTLILQADKDEAVPISEAINLFNYIEGAELAIVPSATHSLSMGGRSNIFTSIVIDFIDRLTTREKEGNQIK